MAGDVPHGDDLVFGGALGVGVLGALLVVDDQPELPGQRQGVVGLVGGPTLAVFFGQLGGEGVVLGQPLQLGGLVGAHPAVVFLREELGPLAGDVVGLVEIRREDRRDLPVLLGGERVDFPLALHDQTYRDRLDPPG